MDTKTSSNHSENLNMAPTNNNEEGLVLGSEDDSVQCENHENAPARR